LCLRQNLLTSIEGLEDLTSLKELDLYDNQISKIENLIPSLRSVDLSFNSIRVLENFDQNQYLEQLYLISNKISTINTALSNLPSLILLELGSNRIRVFPTNDCCLLTF
jgi:protein phosphatase 1 regulatory subunit 7